MRLKFRRYDVLAVESVAIAQVNLQLLGLSGIASSIIGRSEIRQRTVASRL